MQIFELKEGQKETDNLRSSTKNVRKHFSCIPDEWHRTIEIQNP